MPLCVLRYILGYFEVHILYLISIGGGGGRNIQRASEISLPKTLENFEKHLNCLN